MFLTEFGITVIKLIFRDSLIVDSIREGYCRSCYIYSGEHLAHSRFDHQPFQVSCTLSVTSSISGLSQSIYLFRMSRSSEDSEPPLFKPISSPPLAHQNTKTSRRLSRTISRASQKESRDPQLDVNLPYRTLSTNANLAEYTTEKPEGGIGARFKSDGKPEYELVTFLPGDPENPKNWSKTYKWYCTMVVAATCFVVAFASSVITADIIGVQEEFGVSEEVALLSITLFVVGFGVGMLRRLLSLTNSN